MARAYVFDAYGTLFDVHSVAARCESFWPGQGAPLSQLWRAKQLEYTWLRSLMRRHAPFSQVTREALQYACEFLKLSVTASQVGQLMDEYRRLAPYPDVAASLDRLKGARLAILTNGSPDMIDPLVRNHGMTDVFDAVLSVDAAQVFKPSPTVYALAVERLGVPKEEVTFVSSNCWDALGAKSFGFRVCWINRLNAPVDGLGFQPDAILATLGDLPAPA